MVAVDSLNSWNVQHSNWTTYVKVPHSHPTYIGVLCENVFFEVSSTIRYARVYRPYAPGVTPPIVANTRLYDKYTMVKYDDGVICYCYEVDYPINSHTRLDRYSPDDEFMLREAVNQMLPEIARQVLSEQRE